MRTAWIVAWVMILSGCAGMQAPQLQVSGLEKSEALKLQDLRPATEKEKEVFSSKMTSPALGVTRNPEAITEPTALRFFKHRVFEKFGKDADVKVHHLVAYTNSRTDIIRLANLVAMEVSSIGNQTVKPIVSDVDPAQFAASASREYERGLYTRLENPNDARVIMIYLDAEINGKRHFIRRLSAGRPSDGVYPHNLAVEATVEAFLAKY